jgi:hypothetical protein
MADDSGVYDHADRLHHVPAYESLIQVCEDHIISREAIEFYGGVNNYLERNPLVPNAADTRLARLIRQGHRWQQTIYWDNRQQCYGIRLTAWVPAELWTLACLKF